MRNIVVKGCIAVFSALLFLAGFWLLLGNVNFWSTGPNWFLLLSSFLISVSGCLLLGWFNSKSIIRALIGAVGSLVICIPVSYLLLAPIAEIVIKTVIPNTNLGLSGSFTGIWFLVLPIIFIELITDNIIHSKRWARLIMGVVIGLLILIGIEIVTSDFGQTSNLSVVRLAFYAPVLWGITVVATNYEREVSNENK